MKNECWELIGMSKQRLGNVSASETATGTNNAVTQSYTQTESLFVAHEYVLGQLYQSMIDAALYTESQKPESTISYITSEGENAFVQVNGSELKFRDLKVFLTNRPEDRQMFQELRALSQAVLQNGGSLHDIIELYSTNSVRQMKKVFKTLKERQEQLQDQQAKQQQQQLDQQQQQAQAALQQAAQLQEEKIAHDDYQAELDRINKVQIAMIAAESKAGPLSDIDTSGTADVLEMTKLTADQSNAAKDYQARLREIQSESQMSREKLAVENRKIDVDLKNQDNDLKIAKINASNRGSKSK
jgi:hypothetical protein